jgi:TonB family protein
VTVARLDAVYAYEDTLDNFELLAIAGHVVLRLSHSRVREVPSADTAQYSGRFPGISQMMKPTLILVSFLFLSVSAFQARGQEVDASQAPPAPAEHLTQPRLPQLVSHPPLGRVQRAMDKTNLSTLQMTIEVRWDADGHVMQARIQDRTASASVEKAALNWVRSLRFQPGSPGKGLIPFQLRNDRRGGGNMPYFPGPGSAP